MRQTFDSNGPDVRIRGSAYQVLEKYLAMARDANSAGDRISAENYLQHAEHYFRILNANSGDSHGPNGRHRGNGRGEANGFDRPGEAEDAETGQQDGAPSDAGAKSAEETADADDGDESADGIA